MEEVIISNSLEKNIESTAKKFLELSKDKPIQIVSHFDTDGITSAAIITKTLMQIDKRFSLKILKSLEEDTIYELDKENLTIFLDLASGSLEHIANSELTNVFIIDHHEISSPGSIPKNIHIINPELHDKQKISSSCLVYLFCMKIAPKSFEKKLSKLAILGMIGDLLDKNIDRLNNNIITNGEIKRRRGLLIYPSTRPINKVLEYCSNPYIPGITGNIKGILELLREINFIPKNGKYKTLMELNDDEMEKLVTAIMLRTPKAKTKEIIGDIFLINFFNKLEDAREISAMINACSRLGKPHIALQFCLEVPSAKKKAELIHTKYKQFLVSGLKVVSEAPKIIGKNFMIINAKEQVKDTIIGTIASILSNSSIYEEGTIIVTMAYYDDKIKISARIAGRNGRNVREILDSVVRKIGGEVGGHEAAAGAIISQEKEQEFLELLKKDLEIELVKI